jgi:hypothetical protein
MKLILLIQATLFCWFIAHAIKHVGVLPSISDHYYHPRVNKAFTAAMWAIGGLFTIQGDFLLHLAGLFLIGVPIFGDFKSRWTHIYHYISALGFFILAGAAAGLIPALLCGGVVAAGFLLSNKIKNSLYYAELIGIIIIIISLFK